MEQLKSGSPSEFSGNSTNLYTLYVHIVKLLEENEVDFSLLQHPADQPTTSLISTQWKHIWEDMKFAAWMCCWKEQNPRGTVAKGGQYWLCVPKCRYSVLPLIFCHCLCSFLSCWESVILHPAMWESFLPDGWEVQQLRVEQVGVYFL